jgi:hypothetical protein
MKHHSLGTDRAHRERLTRLREELSIKASSGEVDFFQTTLASSNKLRILHPPLTAHVTKTGYSDKKSMEFGQMPALRLDQSVHMLNHHAGYYARLRKGTKGLEDDT